MRIGTIMLGATLCVAAACGNPPETDGQPGAPPPPETGGQDASGGEARVQPEWDALDRTADTCGMAAVRGYVGERASEIPDSRLPEQVRVLAPTDRATMDYVPQRLNVLTDEGGTVIGFKCG